MRTVINFFFALSLSGLLSNRAWAEALPARLSSAIAVKLIAMEQSRAGDDSVAIYVVGGAKVYSNLRRIHNAGQSGLLLAEPKAGSGLPKGKVDVIYLAKGYENQLPLYVDYARNHNALLIGESPEYINQGLVFAIFNDKGLPGVMLNINESNRLKLKWDPQVLEVVKLVD